VCDKALRGLGCEKARWRYDDFEASFLEFVEELDLGSIVNSESEEQTRLKLVHDIESHRGKITSLEEEMDETLQLRTNNATARERVQKKLDELGQQIDAEKVTLKQKEHELQSRKFQPIDMDELRRTIARLQNGNGDRDVYKLRAQIASRLKALVSTIFVAVEGSVPLIDKVKDYEVEEGEVDITKLAPTDPRVTGRWFGAKFRDQGKVLIIAPNPDNPRELTRGSVVAPVLIPDVQE
jgi:hypothetical protein